MSADETSTFANSVARFKDALSQELQGKYSLEGVRYIDMYHPTAISIVQFIYSRDDTDSFDDWLFFNFDCATMPGWITSQEPKKISPDDARRYARGLLGELHR